MGTRVISTLALTDPVSAGSPCTLSGTMTRSWDQDPQLELPVDQREAGKQVEISRTDPLSGIGLTLLPSP